MLEFQFRFSPIFVDFSKCPNFQDLMFRKPKAKGTLRKRLSEDDSGTGSGATEQEKNDKDKDAQVFFNSRVPETFCN